MDAKDRFLNKLQELFTKDNSGFTTQDCIDYFDINRNVISHYLNRLVDDGYLVKENSRPVKYFLNAERSPIIVYEDEEKDSIFESFVGFNGSLKGAIQLCKSSVNYPPNGLPLLITGESGVGKSFLASLIHSYAIKNKIILKNAPFITLNCADYSNNPELLSATLFGNTKGAYTGAEKDRTGILDEANNGYLFLDEVHRLSYENQEKLFLFMDQGFFYRLGDNKQRVERDVRLIFATTEDIDTVLTETFKRRIPIKVTINNFSARPYAEKLKIILEFIHRESINLSCNIQLSKRLIDDLLNRAHKGNVGELKNTIKVLCANAYKAKEKSIYIGGSDSEINNSTNIIIRPEKFNADNEVRFDSSSSNIERIFSGLCLTGNIDYYSKEIYILLTSILGEDYPKNPVVQLYINTIMRDVSLYEETIGLKVPDKFIKPFINTILFSIYANHQLIDEIYSSIFNLVENKNNKYKVISDDIIEHISNELVFDRVFSGLIVTVILQATLKLEGELQAIIVSHGKSTASSIACTANHICGGYYYKSFDMPLDVSTAEIVELLVKYIDKLNTRTGLIILVDMGSLTEIYNEIKLYLQSDLLVVNNVTTFMAIDIASKIQANLSITQIAESIHSAYKVEAKFYEGVPQGDKILISCISGEGIAKKIKDIFSCYVSDNIEIITMEYEDLKWKVINNDPVLLGTKLIVTTTELESPIVPIVNVHDLIREKSSLLLAKYFNNILDIDQLRVMIDELVKLFTVEGVASRLSFLNPQMIVNEIENIIQFYEKNFDIHFESYLRINMFMHTALLIERMMLGQGIQNRDQDEISLKQSEFIDLTHLIFTPIYNKYKIRLTKTEALMIYEILEPWL